MSRPWLVPLRAATPDTRLTLACFPPAGAAAQFFVPWVRALPPDIAVLGVQAPGRWERLGEPPLRSVAQLADQSAAALALSCGPGLVLVGHSLGALVAFEAARALRRADGPAPALLVVSGAPAPQRPHREPDLGDLADQPFLEVVSERYGGISPEVLAEPALRPVILPALRADLAAFVAYRYQPDVPLACPILALAGSDDVLVDDHGLAAWAELTSAACQARRCPGGHFFVRDQVASCLAVLLPRLMALPGDSGQAPAGGCG